MHRIELSGNDELIVLYSVHAIDCPWEGLANEVRIIQQSNNCINAFFMDSDSLQKYKAVPYKKNGFD